MAFPLDGSHLAFRGGGMASRLMATLAATSLVLVRDGNSRHTGPRLSCHMGCVASLEWLG